MGSQSRFVIGFLCGVLAASVAWHLIGSPADPTGAAVGFDKAQPAKGAGLALEAKAKAKPEPRSHEYTAFVGLGGVGETLFELTEGDQPEGVTLLDHCKLECDWEVNCRGVDLRTSDDRPRCALKGAEDRVETAGAQYHHKGAALEREQVRQLAATQLEVARARIALPSSSRLRMARLGVADADLDAVTVEAVKLIEQIAGQADTATVESTWQALLKRWVEPSPASVDLFVRWATRMGYEVADANLQREAAAIERLNAERGLIADEHVRLQKLLTAMAAADAMAPVEPAVHPTDLGVRELNGAVVMVERKQVDIATKAALESRVAALNTASERADEALKASRSKLSVLLKSQQTLFQSLSKLGETLIATRADARDTKAL